MATNSKWFDDRNDRNRQEENNESLASIHASDCFDDLEFSVFWSGKPEGERREAEVGFAIKKDIVTKLPRPVSDKIMTMRLPLSKDNFATIISVYKPR